MKKIFLTANGFQRDCARLAKKVLDSAWEPQLVVALWRGGAQPGVILTEIFDFLGRPKPHMVLKCGSYVGIGQQNDAVTFDAAVKMLDELPEQLRVLVVDDVFDTGRTAAALLERMKHLQVRTAMVYWKPHVALVPLRPDFYVRETDEWIVFPHELKGLTQDEVIQKDPELADILYA